MGAFEKSRFLFSLLVLATVGSCYLLSMGYFEEERLPVMKPTDFNPELVDVSVLSNPEDHVVSDFELTNQDGKTITYADYRDKVYVANFFFTRCPSICPVMTINMQRVQQVFLEDNGLMLLSMSVTPELDSVSILKTYAEEHGAIPGKWNITTGDREHIYDLARKSYFAVMDEGDGGMQDFIHTPNFILIDNKRRIRGVYDGTKDFEVERLIKDIRSLRPEL